MSIDLQRKAAIVCRRPEHHSCTVLGQFLPILRKTNVKADLEPLELVDKALGFVPMLGKGAKMFTKIRLDLSGPLDNPKINLALHKGVADGVKETTKEPGKIIKGITDIFKKEKK